MVPHFIFCLLILLGQAGATAEEHAVDLLSNTFGSDKEFDPGMDGLATRLFLCIDREIVEETFTGKLEELSGSGNGGENAGAKVEVVEAYLEHYSEQKKRSDKLLVEYLHKLAPLFRQALEKVERRVNLYTGEDKRKKQLIEEETECNRLAILLYRVVDSLDTIYQSPHAEKLWWKDGEEPQTVTDQNLWAAIASQADVIRAILVNLTHVAETRNLRKPKELLDGLEKNVQGQKQEQEIRKRLEKIRKDHKQLLALVRKFLTFCGAVGGPPISMRSLFVSSKAPSSLCPGFRV